MLPSFGSGHDYTRKKGVWHSEIILPDNAPPEYKDRETLWNAVERAERRKDAQLAREFIVGLQREFDLQEQKEVLREYIRENFVDKGMIADFAVHHNEGNPHAHIMLTTRDVTPEGFGFKNTTWNENDLFLEWRKSWADCNNRMFERKGLDERIDHRSYKDQGIDKEPTVHLGYKAAALERQGIKTERGNHNREVQKRNAERAAIKEETRRRAEQYRLPKKTLKELHEQLKAEKTEQHEEELRQIAKEVKLENELQKIRQARIEKSIDPESPFVSELEKQLKVEKAMQHLEKMQEQQNSAEKITKRMNALRESMIDLEKEKKFR